MKKKVNQMKAKKCQFWNAETIKMIAEIVKAIATIATLFLQ